eukprot:6478741-Amphidinium_carterae.4
MSRCVQCTVPNTLLALESGYCEVSGVQPQGAVVYQTSSGGNFASGALLVLSAEMTRRTQPILEQLHVTYLQGYEVFLLSGCFQLFGCDLKTFTMQQRKESTPPTATNVFPRPNLQQKLIVAMQWQQCWRYLPPEAKVSDRASLLVGTAGCGRTQHRQNFYNSSKQTDTDTIFGALNFERRTDYTIGTYQETCEVRLVRLPT